MNYGRETWRCPKNDRMRRFKISETVNSRSNLCDVSESDVKCIEELAFINVVENGQGHVRRVVQRGHAR